MATKNIAWNTGTGNITLTYSGQGNGTVLVESDPNDVYEDRSQTIVVSTTAGSPVVSRQVTIIQGMKHPNFMTADGYWWLGADNKYFNVKEEEE